MAARTQLSALVVLALIAASSGKITELKLVRADSGFALSMKNSKPVTRFQLMLSRIPVGADVMVGPGELTSDAGFLFDYDETTRTCTGFSLFGKSILKQHDFGELVHFNSTVHDFYCVDEILLAGELGQNVRFNLTSSCVTI